MTDVEALQYLKNRKEIAEGAKGLADLWLNDPEAHSIMHQLMDAMAYPGKPVAIQTENELNDLREVLSDLPWPCVAAETEHGRPIIVFESEDGDLYVTNGDHDVRPSPADSWLPFRVISPEAIRRLHQCSE